MTWRTMSTYSRVRASGFSNDWPYQPSTTWGPETPSPSTNRPPRQVVEGQGGHPHGRRRPGRQLTEGGAEPDPLGPRTPPGQRGEGVGPVGLGRPDRVEAEALGLGHQLAASAGGPDPQYPSCSPSFMSFMVPPPSVALRP